MRTNMAVVAVKVHDDPDNLSQLQETEEQILSTLALCRRLHRIRSRNDCPKLFCESQHDAGSCVTLLQGTQAVLVMILGRSRQYGNGGWIFGRRDGIIVCSGNEK